MLFPTLAFHLFFVIVFFLNWLLRRAGDWRTILLLVASWIFYGAWDWRFVALLIASAALNWGAAQLLYSFPKMRKFWLLTGVCANLLILGFFKYYGFLTRGADALLAAFGFARDIPLLDIVLPVGISFFTFQGMSYVIDVYQGKTKPARLLELTFLMSFFPHLVAGPIVRPSHILPQLRARPLLSRGEAATCLLLILWGVVKKAVIANDLAVLLVDPVFSDPNGHATSDLLIAAYGYAVQIYCDFSAYTDIAIGLAGLLGFRFPRNFDQPYRAATLQDFWRRWHISLSSWLRDYLYIAALGGSRQGLWRTCLALWLTMVLGGLWHGASLNFVIWGMMHGTVLMAERLWRLWRPASLPALPQWLGVIVTFHIVTVAWIFFRCKTFAEATAFLGRIVSPQDGAFIGAPWTVLLIVIGMACHFGPPHAIQWLGQRTRRLPFWVIGLAGTLVLLLVEGLRGDGMAPFIYFQF